MFIRYNSTAKFWEYDTSVNSTGAGPWVTLPEVFSQDVTIVKTVPGLVLNDAAEPSGLKVFRVATTARLFYIQALSDDLLTPASSTIIDRIGNLNSPGNIACNSLSIRGPLSSDPHTLDNYEEGTWTPGMQAQDGGVGTAYYIQWGTYTRIGNRVNCSFDVQIQSANWGTNQNLYISGFPFVSSGYGSLIVAGVISYHSGLSGNIYTVNPSMASGSSIAYLHMKTVASGSSEGMLTTFIPAGARFMGSLEYGIG